MNRPRMHRFLIERDGPNCMLCGKPFEEEEKPTLDHIEARWWGGGDNIENLQRAHRRCNMRKGVRRNLSIVSSVDLISI